MFKGTRKNDLQVYRLSARMMVLGLVLVTIIGCAPVGTQPVDVVTPTVQSIPTSTEPVEMPLPDGWERYVNDGQCRYAISHPAEMEGASQDTYSWILSPVSDSPSGPVPNFVYVSVIPDGFQGNEIIYNYDPAEIQILLNMQVGESKSLREDPNLAPSFTYTRLPDTTLSNQPAQAYENNAPWEFPQGTKEIRYYLKANGCTYLIGGYMDATGANPSGGISQALFEQIISTFQVTT